MTENYHYLSLLVDLPVKMLHLNDRTEADDRNR